jgi:single-strand DNA-binding protein
MASSLNKVTLIGNVGKDPEIRNMSDGKEIANFSIATSESWKDKASGERKERTEWHRIVVFNEALVNLVKNYVKRGSKLYIEGALQTRKWVDNTGQEKYTTEIVLQGYASNITLLDSRASSESGDFAVPGNASANNAREFAHSELDDEIPF